MSVIMTLQFNYRPTVNPRYTRVVWRRIQQRNIW